MKTRIVHIDGAVGKTLEEVGGKDRLVCDFCKKEDGEVRLLLIGSKSTICDECVQMISSIVDDETGDILSGV